MSGSSDEPLRGEKYWMALAMVMICLVFVCGGIEVYKLFAGQNH